MSDDGGSPPPAAAPINQSRNYNKHRAMILFGLLVMSTVMIYIFIDNPYIAPAAKYLSRLASRSPPPFDADTNNNSIDLLKVCNGRGVLVQSSTAKHGRCVCDIGWTGTDCQKRIVHSAPKGGTVLLVVDDFAVSPATAPLFPAFTAPMSTLAGFMARSGLSLTVLVAGTKFDLTSAERRLFERQFPNAQLAFLSSDHEDTTNDERTVKNAQRTEKQHSMTQSARVLRFLSTTTDTFEYVIFAGHSGIGYATLSAVRQGYHCIPSLFAVLMDGPTEAQRQTQVAERADFVVTDASVIRRDYMQQRSVELADALIAPHRILVDLLADHQWRLPETVFHLPMLTIPVTTTSNSNNQDHHSDDNLERADDLIPARQPPIREFVYVGPLGAEGGLEVFLGAVDALLARDARAHRRLLGKAKHVKVTFFGPNAVMDASVGTTGEHVIEERALSWTSRVKWSVSREGQLKRIFRYLMEPGKARLAILPSPHDPSSPATFFLHQALRAGVPVLAANLRSNQELVHLQDRRDCLFPVNDAGGLARRMAEAWSNGILLARPQVTLRHLETQWRQLLADLNARPPQQCPHTDHVLASDETWLSVVLVHHNRPHLLRQAIASLEQQTMVKNLQVVLVDDGSTDPEAESMLSELAWRWWQERGWKVLREPNRYLGAARNTGARHARGKYIMFMDDDDLAKPGKAEAMLRVAEATGADIVTCGHDTFSGDRLRLPLRHSTRYLPVGPSKALGVLENCFGDASFLVHRQFFLDSGGFTEEYGVGFEDYEYLAKMAVRDNHVETIPDALNLYRQHLSGSSMSQETDLKANQMRFMRAYLDMFTALSVSLQRLVRHAQYIYFERDGPKPFFYQNCGCNSTCTDEPITTSTSTSGSGSVSTSDITITTTSTGSVSSSTGVFSSSTFITTDFTFNSTTTISSSSSVIISSTTRQSTETASSTTTTTVSSRQCPCRSIRKRRTQSTQQPSRSIRPTCYTTATITPTITRSARPCTVVTTVELPPACIGPDCFVFDGTSLLPPPDNSIGYTLSTTVMVDQAPPRPPLARSAEFLPNGAQIVVKFDQPVNVQVGQRFECQKFFDVRPITHPNGAFLVSNDANHADKDCRAMFVSPVEMRVALQGRWLGRDPKAAKPQSLLIFRPGVLGNVGTMNRAYVSGSVEIVAPEEPVKPTVIIDGPAGVVIGDSDVHIDLSRSIGGGGRPFVDAQFDMHSTAGAAFMDAPLQQLLHSAAMDAVKRHRLHFVIPHHLLQDYVTYTLHVAMWNFMHEVGTATITFSKVPAGVSGQQASSSRRRPLVIVGPSTVSQSAPVVLSVMAADNKQYKYHWFPIKTPMGQSPSLKIKNAGRSSIQFEPHQLPIGRYVIGLRTLAVLADATATAASNSEFVYTHQFDVTLGQPAAQIVGASRQIGSADTITLTPRLIDLTPSAHRLAYPPQQFNYTWRCYQADRQSPCQHRLTGSLLEWQADADGRIVFDGAMVAAGEYEMQVAAVFDQIVSPASVIIVVSAEAHLPILHITSNDPLPGVNDADIHISAVVSHDKKEYHEKSADTNEERYTFTWESLPYCGGDYYATIPNLAHRHATTNDDTDTLSIPASALLPASSYCFRVTIADLMTGKRTFAYHTVTTRHTPEGGWCELSSQWAVGEALRTTFQVDCHGWTADPAAPRLLYQLVAKRRRGDTIHLSTLQDRPRFTTTLDAGHYQLAVVIEDEFGGRVEVPVRQVSMRVPVGTDLTVQRAAFIQQHTHSDDDDDEGLLAVASGFPDKVRQDLNNTQLAVLFAAMDRLAAGSQPHQSTFLLDALQRMSPPKLSVDLRPQALKVISRIASHQHHWCSIQWARRLVSALEPVLANPRGGTAASFLYHDIVNKVEECLATLTRCGQEPVVIDTKLQSWSVGWFDPQSQASIGSFQLPSQLSQLTGNRNGDQQRQQQRCLQYRHIKTTHGNLMRNATIDTNMVELRFTDNSIALTPWFSQPLHHMNITFTIDLSKEAQKKIAYRRVRPQCVWFDRGANASSSWWSREGCQVVMVGRASVTCACSHLTEFAVLLEERQTRARIGNYGYRWALACLLVCILLVSLMALTRLVIVPFVRRKRDVAVSSHHKVQDTDDTDTVRMSGSMSMQSSASTLVE